MRLESDGGVTVRRDSRPWAVVAVVVTGLGAWGLAERDLGVAAVAAWVLSGIALWFLWFRVRTARLGQGWAEWSHRGPLGRGRSGRSALHRVRVLARISRRRSSLHAPEQFVYVAEAVTDDQPIPLVSGLRESIVLRRAAEVATHLKVPLEDAIGDESLVREPSAPRSVMFAEPAAPPRGVQLLEDRVRLGSSLRRESIVFEGDQIVLRVALAGVRVAKFVVARDEILDLRVQARSRRGMQRGLAVITARGPRVLGMGVEPQTLEWLRDWLGWKLWPAPANPAAGESLTAV